jgi:Ca2+/H+ antiporter
VLNVLKLHEDVNEPTWSVIISIVILLVGVLYIVVYILNIDSKELEDGIDDTTESEELLQLQGDRDQ